jgi:hypothetical protein
MSAHGISSRLAWTLAGAGAFAAILAAHLLVARPDAQAELLFRWGYGAGYFGFGVLALGAVARLAPHAGAALWRPLMLASASVLALLETALVHGVTGRPVRLETWMAALFGLALAAILPRLLPQSWLRAWLDRDRRRHG